jgi:uncharacterized protein
MLELPTRVCKLLRWEDGDCSYLYNPRNNVIISTSDLLRDFLTVCEEMNRVEIVDHLALEHPRQDVCELLLRLDQQAGQLGFFDNTPTVYRFTEEDIDADLVDTLTLTLTHACNLRCDYCFDTLEMMKNTHSMSEETALHAVDYLFGGLCGKQKGQIIFTGGEPLLNWPVLVAAVEYAESLAERNGIRITFSLKTNGTLVGDRELDFFAERDFTVQVSIDGDREDHDRARCDHKGVGSFDRAVEASRRITERLGRAHSHIKATLTKQNISNFRHNMRFLVGLGAGLVAPGQVMADASSPHALSDEDRRAHVEALLAVAEELAAGGDPEEAQKMMQAMGFRPTAAGKAGGGSAKYGCGAGLWHLCVDTDGSLLPCYRLSGSDEYLMGNVSSPDIERIREVQKRILPKYNREDTPECRSCWGQEICRKSCVAQSLIDVAGEKGICGDGVLQIESAVKAAVCIPWNRQALPHI